MKCNSLARRGDVNAPSLHRPRDEFQIRHFEINRLDSKHERRVARHIDNANAGFGCAGRSGGFEDGKEAGDEVEGGQVVGLPLGLDAVGCELERDGHDLLGQAKSLVKQQSSQLATGPFCRKGRQMLGEAQRESVTYSGIIDQDI